jgi:hypothetical protein
VTRRLLRFPVRAVDQARLIPTIGVQADAAVPEFLRLQFTLADPVGGAPKLMPLFPCHMEFLADTPTAPLILPGPGDIRAFSDAEYASWQTTGTLRLTLHSHHTAAIEGLTNPPPVIPRIVWLWPVRIGKAFLFDSVRGQVSGPAKLKRTLVRPPTGGSIGIGRPEWPRHAISGFLNGYHPVEVQAHGTDPAQDDAIRFDMPELVMSASGAVLVTIALAGGMTIDDKQDAGLDALAAGVPLQAPRHPRNALLHARHLLTLLRDHLLDAEAGQPLADAVLAPWPTGPRYFSLRWSVPGPATPVYFSGLLPHQEVAVRTVPGNTLLQQRRLPTCGWVSLAQDPPAAGAAEPPPLDVLVEHVGGDLRVTRTNGSRVNLPPNQVRFNFGLLAGEGRVTLQPPGPDPADAAARRAYNHRLATICYRLGRTQATSTAVAGRLRAYERTLQPAGWPPRIPVFRGTRDPWRHVCVRELEALFEGLQRLSFTALAPPPIRPGEAMSLWLMEGKYNATINSIFVAGRDSPFKPFELVSTSGIDPFAPADIAGAARADIQAIVRSFLMWSYWGLDVLTVSRGDPTIRDTRPVWTGGVAAAATAHNRTMNAGLAAIIAAGIVPPTRAAVTDTIQVRRRGATWEWQTRPRHVEVMIWLQYAEYLRRVGAPGLPAGASDHPAFNYIAYNAGVEAAAALWARAQTVLNDPAPPVGVETPEDALASWPLTRREEELTPLPDPARPDAPLPRSRAGRVNGLHFAVITHTYGAVFPWALAP